MNEITRPDGIRVQTIVSVVVRMPMPNCTKKNEFIDVTVRDGKISTADSIVVKLDGTEERTEVKPVWPINAGTFYEMLSQAISISRQPRE